MTDSELLRCPFCDGAAFECENDNGCYVVCDGCCCKTTEYIYKEKHLAVEDWNRRIAQRGKESSEAYLEKLIEACEDWCGINAFDADKGACDEHNCDDDRGMNCSANELLDYIKEIITTLRKDRK